MGNYPLIQNPCLVLCVSESSLAKCIPVRQSWSERVIHSETITFHHKPHSESWNLRILCLSSPDFTFWACEDSLPERTSLQISKLVDLSYDQMKGKQRLVTCVVSTEQDGWAMHIHSFFSVGQSSWWERKRPEAAVQGLGGGKLAFPMLPGPFIQEIILFPMYVLGTFVETQLSVYVYVYLWDLSYVLLH
jgi:hypothetical protein